MIHYIQGSIQHQEETTYIINQHYGIQAHYTGEKKKGEFFLHPYIDDNNKTVQYYAFDNANQKKRFTNLIKISGIGIKTAFHITAIDEKDLEEIVENLDIKALQKTPGVGPKTARRILIELQQNISKKKLKKLQNTNNTHSKQLQKYLEGLGYQKNTVTEALHNYPEKITAKNSKQVLADIIKNI